MGTKATPPSHRSSRAWSGAARESGLRLSPDAAADTVVWPWLWEGPPGNAMRDLLGYRVVLGTSLAPKHRGTKLCSFWPSTEAFGHVSVGHMGWGPGAPSVCASLLSSALTEAGGRRLQPPSLLEKGQLLEGAAGVSRGSGKVESEPL